MAAIIAGARKNREPLIHCAVFLELAAKSPEALLWCSLLPEKAACVLCKNLLINGLR